MSKQSETKRHVCGWAAIESSGAYALGQNKRETERRRSIGRREKEIKASKGEEKRRGQHGQGEGPTTETVSHCMTVGHLWQRPRKKERQPRKEDGGAQASTRARGDMQGKEKEKTGGTGPGYQKRNN